MLRLPELLDDPQLSHRGTYARMQHPRLDHDLPTEDPSSPFGRLGAVQFRPAPTVAEHTIQVCTEVLGMDQERMAALLRSGALIAATRSEEHTSELQSLMRISYAVFCLKKKKTNRKHPHVTTTHSSH